MILGIDFGTCFSSIAAMSGWAPVSSIFDKNNKGIPTKFMYSKLQSKALYGNECNVGEARTHSEDVVLYMKKTIRQNPKNIDMEIVSGGKSFTIRGIVAGYLNYLLEEAKKKAAQSQEFLTTEIEEITVTVPVGIAEGQMTATDYNRHIRSVMTDLTGLPVDKIHIVQEPVAAAIYYLYGEDTRTKYKSKKSILVFDLGGGTLDVTIVAHDPIAMSYAIKAKEGDLNLGGNDWDNALAELIMSKLNIKKQDFSQDEYNRFHDNVIKLKEQLSDTEDDEEILVSFKCGGVSKCTEITKIEFEEATKHLLDRAMEITKKALFANSSLGAKAIDQIVLVGGGSNMPQIRDRMVGEFGAFLGENNILTHDPSKAIAKGAAIFSKLDNAHVNIVKDIATLTYGFGSTNSELHKSMIYNLLFKGTAFDENGVIFVKTPIAFVGLTPDQKEIQWIVYESDVNAKDCLDGHWIDYGANAHKNGMSITITVPKEYSGKADKYRCFPSFKLDTNGILEITITDEKGKQLGYQKKQI